MPTNPADIRHLEELALNAWPALSTLTCDGWLLRFANGYTRRANSINPLYPSVQPVEDLNQKLEACEVMYQRHGLPTVFKMTSACYPADLDSTLEQRGYVHDALTSVQTLDLEQTEIPNVSNATVAEQLTEDWLALYLRLSSVDARHVPTMTTMLKSILPTHCFASLSIDGVPVAAGMAVAERGYVGFYDIVVDPAHRQRGYGTQLMQNLLAWGKSQGSMRAYLQVMCNNAPALRLYDGLGFREVYRYWYRVRKS